MWVSGNSGRFPFFKNSFLPLLRFISQCHARWRPLCGYLKEILTHWLGWSENKSGWLVGLLYGLREKKAFVFSHRANDNPFQVWDSAATPRAQRKYLKILSICRCDSVSASFRDDVASSVSKRNRTWRWLQKFAR